MSKVYEAAKRLGIRVTAKSQGRLCPRTRTTVVLVSLADKPLIRPSRPKQSIAAAKSCVEVMREELEAARAAGNEISLEPFQTKIVRRTKEGSNLNATAGEIHVVRWKRVLQAMKPEQFFVTSTLNVSSIRGTAKKLGLRVRSRGTGKLDEATRWPEVSVWLAQKQKKLGAGDNRIRDAR